MPKGPMASLLDRFKLRHKTEDLDEVIELPDRCLLNNKVSPASVMGSLQKAEWVHFASHGSLDPENVGIWQREAKPR